MYVLNPYFFCLNITRLRHERLRRKPKTPDGPNAYQSLTCYDLDVTPPIPPPPDTSSINDPFDIKF